MIYVYKHSAGFLMLEMVVSLALFSLMCALYVHFHVSATTLVRRGLDQHNAVTLASALVQQVRAGTKAAGTYTEAPYAIDISTHPYHIPMSTIVAQLICIQVSLVWQECGSGARRELIVVAGTYHEE
jgi:uncharacterized membrane protein YjjP (DUF1212 family)